MIRGQVFNLGCGERISLNRLWREIKEHTGTAVDVEYGPRRPVPLSELCEAVVAEFEVDRATCEPGVHQFVGDLDDLASRTPLAPGDYRGASGTARDQPRP